MVITPASWRIHKSSLQRTPSGLLNLVGLFGSTHKNAMWRKDREFLSIFDEALANSFDPQIDEWEPSFAAIEAEVLADAAVIVIRLENNELVNGSLGSIAEIGMALASAALRGQVVVVSIEDGLLTSLNDPGAVAQYMLLEMFLEEWEESPEVTGLLHIHRGDDLHELATIACEAARMQLVKEQTRVGFEEFLLKKSRRRHNYPMHVVVGGSGGAYAEVYQSDFLHKRQLLIEPYLAQGQIVKILSEGAVAEAWKIPYGSVDHIGRALAMRTLFSIEFEYKRDADVLLLPVMSEAASKAAVTEIGLLLLHTLTTGQIVEIYLEPFNPVDYVRQLLKKVDMDGRNTEKAKRLLLQEAGVDNDILATATRDEVDDTCQFFGKLMVAEQLPSVAEIKTTLLGKTQAFQTADNIRRVRSLVQAHLEKLHSDERFPGFFSYSTQILGH
jgi:hypothetical protein